jgi:hypothetical protein
MRRQNVGNREREVVADEIVRGIAGEDAGKHAPAMPPILAVHSRKRDTRRARGRYGVYQLIPHH